METYVRFADSKIKSSTDDRVSFNRGKQLNGNCSVALQSLARDWKVSLF